MKKIYSLILFSIIYFNTKAQLSFIRNDSIPVTDQSVALKLPWAGGLNYPMFNEMDLNGDGIMDLVVYEGMNCPGHDHLMPFLNYGTHGQVDYHYAPQYISRFPPLNAWMATYDYNCDGKMDIFSLSIDGAAPYSGITVYRNDFDSISGLKFTLVANPIYANYYGYIKTNIPVSQISVPAFADIDNDGYMDIISFPPAPNGMLEYQRNTAIDSGWPCDSLRFTNVSQCWGGFALDGQDSNRVSSFGIACRMMQPDTSIHWDNGTTHVDDGSVFDILVYDNDGDGLKDCLFGAYGFNNALFVHNGGSLVKDNMDYQVTNFPNYDVPVNLPSFPCFFYIDGNNDGAKDLIVNPHSISNFSGVIW